MNRGLYGQTEGNESRSNNAVMEDRLSENFIAEGEWMVAMNNAAKDGDMKEMGRLRDAMKAWGVKGGVCPAKAQERADSVLRQASIYLKL